MALLILAVIQLIAYIAEIHDTRTVERAYVDASPKEGLKWDQTKPIVQFVIKNYGATPADVVGWSMILHHRSASDPLPPIPPYGQEDNLGAFIMPSGSIHVAGEFPSLPSPAFQAIMSGEDSAWLLGYVDYRDRFGRRHRGGFARRYLPQFATLAFENQRGYNYDRRRKKGEGNDWSQSRD